MTSVEELDDFVLEEIFQTEGLNLPSTSTKSFEAALSESSPSAKKKKIRKNETTAEEKAKTTKNTSLIHNGDTDSSDDEDNRNFLEQKYNDCGRDIRSLLNVNEKSNQNSLSISDHTHKKLTNSSWKPKPIESSSEQITDYIQPSIKSDAYTDPVFSIRITHPQISSKLIKERMVGRVAVSLAKIKKFTETEDLKNKDWVTGGVIIGTSTKTSQKGNQYSIWTITDLHGDIKTISVFLFRSAFKELWTTAIGTVVGILNPTLMEKKDKSKCEVVINVDNAQKIMIFGFSKDYGTCKSKTKSGEPCSNVINTSKCLYCVYHVKQEYKKASTRLELQSACAGRGLNDLRNKVLGKNEVFYGGQSYCSVPSKKSLKQMDKDEKLLKKLSCPVQSVVRNNVLKDKSIIDRLDNKTANITPSFLTPSRVVVPSRVCTPLQNTKITSHFPPLNPPTASSFMIDLNVPVSKKKLNMAKMSAIQYVRRNGKISTNNDKTPEQKKEAIKRRLSEDLNVLTKKVKTDENVVKDSKTLLKEKLERCGITEEFLKIMNTGCEDKQLENLAESQQMDKYYKKLEIKESMEEKMLSTYKIECKAVRCLKCNYKSFSASDMCKKEKHPLKIVNAVKRFWKCGDCNYRTVSLELIPLHSCKQCGGSKWEKTSMMKEKKDNNLVRPNLSIRGHEESVLGGHVSGDINLLVPS